jgi:hypothetical protein
MSDDRIIGRFLGDMPLHEKLAALRQELDEQRAIILGVMRDIAWRELEEASAEVRAIARKELEEEAARVRDELEADNA